MLCRDCYITSLGVFLPNKAVKNDNIEKHIGLVNHKPSRYKAMTLAANGIVARYYAFDETGKQTHSNEELAANAITMALNNRGYTVNHLDYLATGTTMPDLLIPGFASMVHGKIGGKPMETLSSSGVCVSSMIALKAAHNAVSLGEHQVAAVVGSEMPSVIMQGTRFEQESTIERRTDVDPSYQYFNGDFLRWMLSDGAGAAILENKPNPTGLSLKVEWISIQSYAHKYPTCMYMGTSQPSAPSVGNIYQSFSTMTAADKQGLFILRQDTKLLPIGLKASVIGDAQRLIELGKIKPETIDHFLPHVSSMFFYHDLMKAYQEIGMDIPQEKWFTNLTYKGNTGAASIFIMLEEAFNEGRFQKGDSILCMIPESGRFLISYMLLTCE